MKADFSGWEYFTSMAYWSWHNDDTINKCWSDPVDLCKCVFGKNATAPLFAEIASVLDFTIHEQAEC